MSAPAAALLTPRPIYMEDLAVGTIPGTQTTAVILGLGSATVTYIPLTLLTQLVVATNDAAAATAGVAVGSSYINSTLGNVLHTRMS
jgi:hypothetical protein